MTIKGDLQYMNIAGLIQHNCQGHKTARLVVKHKGQEATLFLNKGTVQHAIMNNLQGEAVVYETLNWHEGHFTLEMGVEPPLVTITRSGSSLLLEGARRLNEESNGSTSLNHKNLPVTNKKRKILSDLLSKLLQHSSNIEGAAIVDKNGLVYSANVPHTTVDKQTIGRTSATVFDLSKQSAHQFKRGDIKRTLIQGDKGNIIVTGINDKTFLIGLTVPHVNLGMAFTEMRTMTALLNSIL